MGMSEGGTVSEMKMADIKRASDDEMNGTMVAAEKRVILSMGGKGGVGKTSVMAALAEWFEANEIPVKLLDLDTLRHLVARDHTGLIKFPSTCCRLRLEKATGSGWNNWRSVQKPAL